MLTGAGVERLNALSREEARTELLACCGCQEWARRMEQARPFRNLAALLSAADEIWRSLSQWHWTEAFAHHPRIGENATGQAGEEQTGARKASPAIREALARANRNYEEKFGRVFLVCATGKSAEEMLALCRERLHNDSETEMRIASEEQRKIISLRLQKAFPQ
jgi:OHCU decarboxylase